MGVPDFVVVNRARSAGSALDLKSEIERLLVAEGRYQRSKAIDFAAEVLTRFAHLQEFDRKVAILSAVCELREAHNQWESEGGR